MLQQYKVHYKEYLTINLYLESMFVFRLINHLFITGMSTSPLVTNFGE